MSLGADQREIGTDRREGEREKTDHSVGIGSKCELASRARSGFSGVGA